ncbi:hypothetical protein TrLO_g15178 [Triparma laevis f. longispina]|uniref:Uncharacterized protein n=1 Tax=Triparma laevis f. longispina TaxID=1714387 RepID=A0A9W7FNW5_9STRA|nr:hypothetical protein TrLO_g15178 [Triparma laevis f. longispina]
MRLVNSFASPELSWHNGTPEHKIKDNRSLTIIPTPGLDYWSKTFNDPLLVKHDAQTLLAQLPDDKEATFTMSFALLSRKQFDQTGIMVLVDNLTWVKAGIEFTDGSLRLSCVVTNDGFSDWSTQMWDDWSPEEARYCWNTTIAFEMRLHDER